MEDQTRVYHTAELPSLGYPPECIETMFDFAQGIQTALKEAMAREHSGEGDTEGAEISLEDAVVEGAQKTYHDEGASVSYSLPILSPYPALDIECSSLARWEGSAAGSVPLIQEDSSGYESSADPKDRRRTRKRKQRSKVQKAKKKMRSKEHRNERRRDVRQEQDAFDYKPPLYTSRKFQDIKTIQCDITAEDFKRAQGAWIALRLEAAETPAKEIEDLLAAGLRLVPWNGVQPMLVTDKEGRAVAMFSGVADASWQTETVPAVQAQLDETAKGLHFGAHAYLPVSKVACKENRRGQFKTAAVGVSYGGGQTQPGNLKHTPHNLQVLNTFLRDPHVQRVMKFGNSMLAHYAPRLYKYYVSTLQKLFESDRRLHRICKGSVFPAFSLNFGPKAVSYKHRDHSNLADGLCWIMPCGDFNPKLGGHLILWELGVVVEFPPGSCALIPSAVISHENVSVQEDEIRSSVTQYAAGGLFRWVEYGFRGWEDVKKQDFQFSRQILAERATRWKTSIALYSRFDSLVQDRHDVFYLA